MDALPEDLDLLLTPKERDAVLCELLPRHLRTVADRVAGRSKQARCNAKRRAAEKLAKARGLPSV